MVPPFQRAVSVGFAMGKGVVMSPIKTPVVIVDRRGTDLSIHASIEDAQLHLEAIDVKNNEYAAYDSEGRLLGLDVVRTRPLFYLAPFKRQLNACAFRRLRMSPTMQMNYVRRSSVIWQNLFSRQLT